MHGMHGYVTEPSGCGSPYGPRRHEGLRIIDAGALQVKSEYVDTSV